MRSHKNLDPIGSAVLTFIGYKQTNRQAKYLIFIHHNERRFKDMKEEWMKMLFGRFCIKNYCANYY